MQSIACHEAGHAIVAVALKIGTPVSIRITRNGGTCETDRTVQLETKKYLHQLRVQDLAGRAAERLVTGSISTGSGGREDSDLAVATRRIIEEELSSGMGSNGPLYFGPASSISMGDLSQETQAHLRRRLIDAEEEATEILRANRTLLSEMTRALFNGKELSGEKLAELLTQVKA